jgi:CheY-like chemotaxis protein
MQQVRVKTADEAARVLLVDDDVALVQVFARYLLRRGFVVTTCGGGVEAVKALSGGIFDVVVTDLEMPGMDGFALLAWIGQYRWGMPVVVMSGCGAFGVEQQTRAMGAVAFLHKPATPGEVLQVLEALGHNRG